MHHKLDLRSMLRINFGNIWIDLIREFPSDSCEDVLIENCYISVGDDGIAIKSGWDQYGISYAQPSTNILIRNLVVRSNVRSVNLNKKN